MGLLQGKDISHVLLLFFYLPSHNHALPLGSAGLGQVLGCAARPQPGLSTLCLPSLPRCPAPLPLPHSATSSRLPHLVGLGSSRGRGAPRGPSGDSAEVESGAPRARAGAGRGPVSPAGGAPAARRALLGAETCTGCWCHCTGRAQPRNPAPSCGRSPESRERSGRAPGCTDCSSAVLGFLRKSTGRGVSAEQHGVQGTPPFSCGIVRGLH